MSYPALSFFVLSLSFSCHSLLFSHSFLLLQSLFVFATALGCVMMCVSHMEKGNCLATKTGYLVCLIYSQFAMMDMRVDVNVEVTRAATGQSSNSVNNRIIAFLFVFEYIVMHNDVQGSFLLHVHVCSDKHQSAHAYHSSSSCVNSSVSF